MAEFEVPVPHAGRDFSLEGSTRRALKAAGWESDVGMGGTIWRNPTDAHWYDELKALAILTEGLDPGDPS